MPAPQTLRIKAFVDDETGRPGFVVFDGTSGEVVREIPPEEALALAAKLKQMTGLLVNEAV
ncbi:MAG: flagellar protein FlaG [Nitrospinae bacterium]|nr:flagellar protein FlaG [Nitrospinota bacterium]